MRTMFGYNAKMGGYTNQVWIYTVIRNREQKACKNQSIWEKQKEVSI